ncbi:hypothetical protein VB712_19210 [Spirulina sp. CCNP1310]|uniref:hypothetical protein n=1 Tax=Spirulina sp. CCNP1310 TaxID=3110249 RepID=UPI002B1FD847|nr:hypothetical protein [Spirulina sp. CCNP1310]MEA5421359.1 hypothetical protein [Spirulina sp. CCNP1310]
MSDKDFKDKPKKENRESAQKKVENVVSALNLTKDERRQLHDGITGQDYLDYQEILKIAKNMFDPVNIQSKQKEQSRW